MNPEQRKKLTKQLNKTNKALIAAGLTQEQSKKLTDEATKKKSVINLANYAEWQRHFANIMNLGTDGLPMATFSKVSGPVRALIEVASAILSSKGNGPNDKKYVNNPKFYEAIDMHQSWRIPWNFPDTEYLDYGLGVLFGTIMVLDIGDNPLADQYAVTSRLTQFFDLLKGVRGLSGKQPYSVGDLWYYHQNGKYLVNEYCRLKFSLRLSQLYIMTKSRMPLNLLEALGWLPYDFIANRALYVSALTTLANYITNNYPMFGTDIKRIESLWEKFIPDSNDNKTAGFYKTNIHVCAAIPYTIGVQKYGDQFVAASSVSSYNNSFDKSMYEPATGVTYANYTQNMLTFLNALNSFEQFNPIRADIIGACGKACIWSDSKINEVSDYKFDDLIHPFDELFLTVIQNSTILTQDGFDLVSASVISLSKRDFVGVGIDYKAPNPDGTLPMPAPTQGNAAEIGIRYTFQNDTGNQGKIIFSQTDGSAGYGTNTTVTESTLMISNKYNMSEAEELEITQLLAMFQSCTISYDGTSTETVIAKFQTQSMFLADAKVLYFDPSTKQDSVAVIRHTALTARANLIALSQLSNSAIATQFWSQFDYGPKRSILTCDSSGGSISEALQLDFNIMGSISKSAYSQAIRYSTYSLMSADIKVSEVKKINNIVGVYSMK